MKKQFLIFTLLMAVINLSSALKSMEQKPSPMDIDQSESLWTKLPYELQQIVLSKVALEKATSMEEILEKLKELEKNPLFSKLVTDKAFIADLAKKYIEQHRELAEKEIVEAARKNKIVVVQALIDAGIDFPKKGKALILAVQAGHKEIVKILLDAGADVNAQDNKGWTALMWATFWVPMDLTNQQDIIKMLLEANADVDHKSKKGNRTALTIARDKGRKNIIKMLKETDAK